jgi:iron complex transport system substrate-binding protein
MTLNDTHIISDVIRLCGGRNVFGTLTPLVPTVSTEAVLAANPDAIVTARVRPTKAIGAAAIDAADLDRWRAWPRLTAVAQGNLFAIDADLIDRPTPRLAMAAQQMCTALDQARTHAATQRGR